MTKHRRNTNSAPRIRLATRHAEQLRKIISDRLRKEMWLCHDVVTCIQTHKHTRTLARTHARTYACTHT